MNITANWSIELIIDSREHVSPISGTLDLARVQIRVVSSGERRGQSKAFKMHFGGTVPNQCILIVQANSRWITDNSQDPLLGVDFYKINWSMNFQEAAALLVLRSLTHLIGKSELKNIPILMHNAVQLMGDPSYDSGRNTLGIYRAKVPRASSFLETIVPYDASRVWLRSDICPECTDQSLDLT